MIAIIVLLVACVVLKVQAWNPGSSWRNNKVFIAQPTDPTLDLVLWGDSSVGAGGLSGQLGNVKYIYTNAYAVAALRDDDTLVVFGNSAAGGGTNSVGTLTNINRVYTTSSAFAALTNDGDVIPFGDNANGGFKVKPLENVLQVYTCEGVFSAVNDTNIVAWGSLSGQMPYELPQISPVKFVQSTSSAFAALLEDTSVHTWGNTGDGGSGISNLNNVVEIASTDGAFAARKADGTIVAWGNSVWGGQTPTVTNGRKAYSTIYSTRYAFVTVMDDGQLLMWGDTFASQPPSFSNGEVVSQIATTERAFAIVFTSGDVWGWGPMDYGGNAPLDQSDVKSIYSNSNSFCVIYGDLNTVNCWGVVTVPSLIQDAVTIASSQKAFAVLKLDGSIVAFGDSLYGGAGFPTTGTFQRIWGTTLYRSDSSKPMDYACGNNAYGHSFGYCTPCPNTASSSYAPAYSITVNDCTTEQPTAAPTTSPPTVVPTSFPTPVPQPTHMPVSMAPTPIPTIAPTVEKAPTKVPTQVPSFKPTTSSSNDGSISSLDQKGSSSTSTELAVIAAGALVLCVGMLLVYKQMNNKMAMEAARRADIRNSQHGNSMSNRDSLSEMEYNTTETNPVHQQVEDQRDTIPHASL
jgi:hypothetical protein